jgi:hypothetical protein
MPGIKNDPKITKEEIINVNRSAIEHRATWMGLSFEAAKKAGVNGEKILRAAVSQTGCLHGAVIQEKLEKRVRLDKFADAFLSPVAIKTFEMEFKTKTPEALEIQFHYCPLVSGWIKAGIPLKDIPTLCDIAMDGDRNIAATAGVDFSLGKTIANGDAVCEVSFYSKKQ